MNVGIFFCREEEIRTLDTVTRILPFQGSSFNHSDTSLYLFASSVRKNVDLSIRQGGTVRCLSAQK